MIIDQTLESDLMRRLSDSDGMIERETLPRQFDALLIEAQYDPRAPYRTVMTTPTGSSQARTVVVARDLRSIRNRAPA